MSRENNIPVTRHQVSQRKSDAIRSAVRRATSITTENVASRLAAEEDAECLFEFLSDPQVHAPIYTLPRPLTVETVRAFIADHREQRKAGTGLLFLNFDVSGKLGGYTNVGIWPQWAAGKLGGAIHPDRQGNGLGTKGASLSFNWMFEELRLQLICETASLDNQRTARLLDGLGFRRVGEVLSYRDDGTSRPSLVWEITKPEWDRNQPV